MKLKILKSGSEGNCYLLDSGKEVLVLEAGVPFAKVKQALDFDVKKISGVLISHEHKDHAGYFKQYVNSRVPCYLSEGTLKSLQSVNLSTNQSLVNTIDVMELLEIGDFKVLPFPVEHDASEPLGYLINHPQSGNILFATDTYYLKYKFNDLSNIMIECNYDYELLNENLPESDPMKRVQRDRVLKTHMSYQNCLRTLTANDLSKVNNIVLIHLSKANSNADLFESGIREATSKNVIVAKENIEIEFNKTPF